METPQYPYTDFAELNEKNVKIESYTIPKDSKKDCPFYNSAKIYSNSNSILNIHLSNQNDANSSQKTIEKLMTQEENVSAKKCPEVRVKKESDDFEYTNTWFCDTENKDTRSEKGGKCNLIGKNCTNNNEEDCKRKDGNIREKRRRFYKSEIPEEKINRLMKVTARRREMKMYYETPEQKRKRLDAEADRKRKYRLFTESAEQKRKRLDRDAKRRRLKRMNLYANETPEERRERLNRESAKKREARLLRYANETEEQRTERLRKDALRAREHRLNRSIRNSKHENDKDESKELRDSDLEVKNEEDTQSAQYPLTENYLSNLMVWFQINFPQP